MWTKWSATFESFYRFVSHDPPLHALDDWGGLAAVTLHRCHCTSGSHCALTYLARRWTTYASRAGDGVGIFSAVMAPVGFLWFVRPTPKERVVFERKAMTWAPCRQGQLNDGDVSCLMNGRDTGEPISLFPSVWSSGLVAEVRASGPVGQPNPGFTWRWWTSSRPLPTRSREPLTRLPLAEDQESMWRNRYARMSESRTLWSCDWQKKKCTKKLPAACLS